MCGVHGLGRWVLRHPIASLCMLWAALVVPGWCSRDLWAPDEPRYAEVAREMYVSGQYLVPHLNGEFYDEKPPMFFWMTAGMYHLSGRPYACGGRIVSSLLALVAMMMTYALGCRWSSRAVGLAGAAVLITAIHFTALAQDGVLDVPLAGFIAVAVYGIDRARTAASGKGVVGWTALSCAAAACGVLTKGPVAAALVVIAAVAMAAAARRWRPVTTALAAAIVSLLVGLAWVMLVRRVQAGESGYLKEVILGQIVGRVSGARGHPQPWFYYLKHFPPDFLPWTILWGLALVLSVRHLRREGCRAARFYILWFVLGFVFFSAVGGKRERYLMSLFPAAALLCGEMLLGALRQRHWAWVGVPAIVWCVVVAVLSAVGIGFPFYVDRLVGFVKVSKRLAAEEFVMALTPLRATGISVGAACILAIQVWGLWGVKRQPGRFLASALATVVVGFGVTNAFVWPAYNAVASVRPIAEVLRQMERPGDVVVLFDSDYSGAYNFYLERERLPIRNMGEPLPYPQGPGQRLILVAVKPNFMELPDEERELFEIVYEDQVGRRHTVLAVATKPPDAQEATPP